MKKAMLITVITLFSLNSIAQSFEYKDLLNLKFLPTVGKSVILTKKGFKKIGSGIMTTHAITDTVADQVWVKGEEEIRFNDESVEYQWGDSSYLMRKTDHKSIYKCIDYVVFMSANKYLWLKRRQTIYNPDVYRENEEKPTYYVYLKRKDTYTMLYEKEKTVFIGEIGEIVN